MAKENIKYEEAVSQLEQIVANLEEGGLNIDELSSELK